MTAPAFARPTFGGFKHRARMASATPFVTPRAVVLWLSAFLVVAFARTHELFGVLAPLRLGKLIGLPLVVVAIQRLPRAQVRTAMRTEPSRGAIFIGAMMVLSIPLSIWVGNSVSYVTSTAAITAITFIVTASVLVDRSAIPVVLATEVIAVGFGATRMLLPDAPTVFEDGAMRVHFGFSFDPNDCAALFVLTIPLALYLAGRLHKSRLLWYALAMVMVAALVRTGSRGGLLGFGALVAALAIMAPPKRRAQLTGISLLAAIAFAGFVSQNDSLRARFASTFDTSQSDYNYTETNGRIEIWKRGIHYMITHPVTGVGISNFMVAEYQIGSGLKAAQGITDQHMLTAHNSMIQIGAELGIPGLFAYLYMIGTSVRGTWRKRRTAIAAIVAIARGGATGAVSALENEVALASAVLTALVAVFISGCFLSLAYSPITLFACALAAGVIGGGAPMGGPRREPGPQRVRTMQRSRFPNARVPTFANRG